MAFGKYLRVEQRGQQVWLHCSPEDYEHTWRAYFDLGEDYAPKREVLAAMSPALAEAAAFAPGIRILRQDPWEMIITFVISQQKTIPNIRQLVEALSSRYGTLLEDGQNRGNGEVREKDEVREKEGTRREDAARERSLPPAFSFPAPSQLCLASLEDLMELNWATGPSTSTGSARTLFSGRLDLSRLSALNYEEAMEYLTGFYGIGKKVANCVCLFRSPPHRCVSGGYMDRKKS